MAQIGSITIWHSNSSQFQTFGPRFFISIHLTLVKNKHFLFLNFNSEFVDAFSEEQSFHLGSGTEWSGF